MLRERHPEKVWYYHKSTRDRRERRCLAVQNRMQKIHRNIQYTIEHHTWVITELTTINPINTYKSLNFFVRFKNKGF